MQERKKKKKRRMERNTESELQSKIFRLYGDLREGEGKQVKEEGTVHILGGEEHTSRRHERVREGRRKKKRGDMITKETARKKNPAGKKETECVE